MENTNSIKVLSVRLYELIKSEAYTASTIIAMKSVLNRLSAYMDSNNLVEYTPEVGESFIAHCISKHVCSSLISRTKSITGKLNRMLQGNEGRNALLPGPFVKYELPQDFLDVLGAYLVHSEKTGNRHTTIRNQYLVCGKFLRNLFGLGCTKLQDVTGELIQTAFLAMGYIGYWERLSPFFLFLFEEGALNRNYAPLVRNRRRAMPLPTVYLPEEILRIENSFDLATPSGIRNYSVTLLMTRYGIRSADVAALTFDNVDFENNRLYFIQQKTGDPWEAELLPEVKTALQNYIDNIRPNFKEYPNIFMKLASPYAPLGFGAINVMVKTQFQRTEIDSAERKSGSRALRSSVASNMINDGISTEIVRKVLGHGTKHALRHYARIDVESMRLCPLPVPKPTGTFARLLFPEGVTPDV